MPPAIERIPDLIDPPSSDRAGNPVIDDTSMVWLKGLREDMHFKLMPSILSDSVGQALND
jgi:hypothetical protein